MSCPPNAESGWNCLPTYHYEGDFDNHGSGEVWVYPAYAESGGDTYHSIEAHIDQTPGKSTDNNGWLNERTVEWCDFDNSNYEFQKHGPGTVSGFSSGGFNVGISAGFPAGVSGNLGWSWSEQHSHTDITEEKLGNEEIKHTWEYKKGKDVSKNTVQCSPGYQAKRQDGSNVMECKFDVKWKFKDYRFYLTDKNWWYKRMFDLVEYY